MERRCNLRPYWVECRESYLFRIILGAEPTLKDFWSHKELGKPLLRESMRREWESSASVYDDFEVAVEIALKYPNLGSHIAKIVVPEDGSVEFAQTMKNIHHYSIYASAGDILTLVEGEAIPVSRSGSDG